MKFTRRLSVQNHPYHGIEFVTRKAQIAEGSRVLFEAEITAPSHWSQISVDILASKYMRKKGLPKRVVPRTEQGLISTPHGVIPEFLWSWRAVREDESPNLGVPCSETGGETDARQVFRRLAGFWTYWGWRHGYFAKDCASILDRDERNESARIFYDEWLEILCRQMCAPNSPQWFNAGLAWAYGINGDANGQWFWEEPRAAHPADKAVFVQSPDAYTRPALSACFIQSLDDNLVDNHGIYDLLTREARVFKHGSGSGANYSNLRGWREPLSGGGFSSGLKSFLPVFDRSAGVISSGGVTRRAARMVCLDVDHPDIEWFIDWKMNEEKKVAALYAGSRLVAKHVRIVYDAAQSRGDSQSTRVEILAQAMRGAKEQGVPDSVIYAASLAGERGDPCPLISEYGLGFEDEAYVTVSGQNANNSVRVTNEFLKRVYADEDWHLVGRVEREAAKREKRPPKPHKTLKANALWDQIARAAWECADPGVQFHDTVNEMNGCIKDAEIRATNPCQPGMAMILTDGGSKAIAEIEVGSLVWSGKTWTTVIGKQCTGTHEVFRYNTQSGHSFVGTKNHLVMCRGVKTPVDQVDHIDLDNPFDANAVDNRVLSRSSLGLYPVYSLTVDDPEHTYVSDGLIVANCGEYNWLDDTACNLASLNLRAFDTRLNGTLGFDVDTCLHVVRLTQVVLDLTVGVAAYPSHEIAQGSRAYRTTGIGFTNLGAFLMARGVPYDSEYGRQWGGHLAALVHLGATDVSVDLARELGTFPRYDANREGMIRVTHNHCVYARKDGVKDEYWGLTYRPAPLLAWGPPEDPYKIPLTLSGAVDRLAMRLPSQVEMFGLRNAQISVVAPTGTISLVMGCDTTGCEPDYALVKIKKLAGGGTTTIVNGSVAHALASLGYDAVESEAIAQSILQTGSATASVGDGLLSAQHLPVFACANDLSVEAHIKMMAAVQPVVSGAISKTINLPMSATVDDVQGAYELAHRLGLKAVALYRDGCKMSQPLNLIEQPSVEDPEPDDEPVTNDDSSVTTAEAPPSPPVSIRRKLPSKRPGYTHKLSILTKAGRENFYVRTGEYPGGQLGEIFLDCDKEGSIVRSLLDALAISVSLGLQHGVPLSEYTEAFVFSKFEPFGLMSEHPRLKSCTSVLDAIFRTLAIEYDGRDDLAHVPKDQVVNPYTPTVAIEVDESTFATLEKAMDSNIDKMLREQMLRIDEQIMGVQASHPPLGLWAQSPGPLKYMVPNGIATTPKLPRSVYDRSRACSLCRMYTLVRDGACLKCESCGTTTGC